MNVKNVLFIASQSWLRQTLLSRNQLQESVEVKSTCMFEPSGPSGLSSMRWQTRSVLKLPWRDASPSQGYTCPSIKFTSRHLNNLVERDRVIQSTGKLPCPRTQHNVPRPRAWTYNHGQKSWDKFTFVALFHTRRTVTREFVYTCTGN